MARTYRRVLQVSDLCGHHYLALPDHKAHQLISRHADLAEWISCQLHLHHHHSYRPSRKVCVLHPQRREASKVGGRTRQQG